MKTMEQFLNEITTDKELAEKLAAVKDEGELAEFLKENEVEGTVEDFRELAEKASGELSDEVLETVAGGYFLGIDPTKKGPPAIKLL